MTDTLPVPPPAPPARDPASAMDQALDWLIVLDSPSEEQTRQFHDWLAADALNAEAFAKAKAIWEGQQVVQCAQSLAARPPKMTALSRLCPHWKPLATAAVLILGLFSFSNLPIRLQADHLTVVGERQRLQLEDGSKVLLNTNSAFSSTINDQQRVARLYQGEAFFEVAADRGQPLEISRPAYGTPRLRCAIWTAWHRFGCSVGMSTCERPATTREFDCPPDKASASAPTVSIAPPDSTPRPTWRGSRVDWCSKTAR